MHFKQFTIYTPVFQCEDFYKNKCYRPKSTEYDGLEVSAEATITVRVGCVCFCVCSDIYFLKNKQPKNPTFFPIYTKIQGKVTSETHTCKPKVQVTVYKSDYCCYCCYLITKSYPTVCDPMDCSPPGSSVHWISQARMLEWVAISFSRGSSQPRDQICVSCIGSHWHCSYLCLFDQRTLIFYLHGSNNQTAWIFKDYIEFWVYGVSYT